MEFKNIKIQNFKGIESLNIEFSKNFNLIIGNNGYGKTSVLDAIAISLGGYISGLDGVLSRHIQKQDVRITTKLLGDASYNINYQTPVLLESTVEVDNETFTFTRRKSSYKSSRTTIEPRNITHKATELINNDESILPVISYHGAGRMWSERRGRGKFNSKKEDLSRVRGYVDSLWGKANTKDFVSWCAKMEQISWSENKKITEYEIVKKAVANFMKEMNGEEASDTRIFYSKKEEELIYESNGDRIPISFLSSGYQALIWLAFDIAYRMAVLNPNLRENIIEESPGIVLIDELDVHLHPQWQWKVINALVTTFPKIQFIATTHSPIVLASNDQCNVIIIDRNHHIHYGDSSYGVPIDNILESYQKTTPFPERVKELVKSIHDHLNNNDINCAEKDVEALEHLLKPNNPILVSVKTELEFEKLNLE